MFDQYSRGVKMTVVVVVMLILAGVLATMVLLQRGLIGKKMNPSASITQSQGTGMVAPTTPGDQTVVVPPPTAEIKQNPGAPKLLTPEEVLKERGITMPTPPTPPVAPVAPVAPMAPPAAPAAPAAPAPAQQ